MPRQWMQTIQEAKQGFSWPSLVVKSQSGGDITVDSILHSICRNNDGIVRFRIRSLNFSFKKNLNGQLYNRLMFRVPGVFVDFEEFDLILA